MSDPFDKLKQWREIVNNPELTAEPWSLAEDWAYIASGSDSVIHGYYEGDCPACGDEIVDYASVALCVEDAEFIVAARTAMPALLTAVENVLNDHEPEPYAQGADYCRECCHRWPCATYAAIRDALGGAK